IPDPIATSRTQSLGPTAVPSLSCLPTLRDPTRVIAMYCARSAGMPTALGGIVEYSRRDNIKPYMDSARKRHAASVLCLLAAMCPYASALNPDLDISQYAHTASTARDGFSLGNIYAMGQTPDGYLWLG